MGARLVLYGSLGTFDDVIALELSAFDGDTATSLGRSVVQEKTLKAAADGAAAKVRTLRDEALSKIGAEGRLRILVMDLELRNATSGTPMPAPAPAMSGLGGAAVGSGGARPSRWSSASAAMALPSDTSRTPTPSTTTATW
jgi:hypothetical protein